MRFCCVWFLLCVVLSCAEREERAMWRWGRKKSVRALKKTGCPHGRPVRFCHRSFHRREFFGFRGDGSALFGNERICTVSALVRGGAALAAEPGIKALQPVPGRGGREKFPCRVFRFGGRAVKYRFSRCECEVFAAVLAAGQILHPEVKRRIAAAFA